MSLEFELRLTPREMECLRLVGEQLSLGQIARRLGMSKTSVDIYCARAVRKLSVADRYEAANLLRNVHIHDDDEISERDAFGGLQSVGIVLGQADENIAALNDSTVFEPPLAAERLISYLCPPSQVEAVLGDLEESFRYLSIKIGPAAARRWYWWCGARSIVAFTWNILNNILWDAFKKLSS